MPSPGATEVLGGARGVPQSLLLNTPSLKSVFSCLPHLEPGLRLSPLIISAIIKPGNCYPVGLGLVFSTSFSWPAAQFWEGAPPVLLLLAPFSRVHCEFLNCKSSFPSVMPWSGWLCFGKGAGITQTRLRAPSWESKGDLCPSHSHAQPPKIPGFWVSTALWPQNAAGLCRAGGSVLEFLELVLWVQPHRPHT